MTLTMPQIIELVLLKWQTLYFEESPNIFLNNAINKKFLSRLKTTLILLSYVDKNFLWFVKLNGLTFNF